jgi:hypothetical protein
MPYCVNPISLLLLLPLHPLLLRQQAFTLLPTNLCVLQLDSLLPLLLLLLPLRPPATLAYLLLTMAVCCTMRPMLPLLLPLTSSLFSMPYLHLTMLLLLLLSPLLLLLLLLLPQWHLTSSLFSMPYLAKRSPIVPGPSSQAVMPLPGCAMCSHTASSSALRALLRCAPLWQLW